MEIKEYFIVLKIMIFQLLDHFPSYLFVKLYKNIILPYNNKYYAIFM